MAISARRRIGVVGAVVALGLGTFGVASVRAKTAPDLPAVPADRLLASVLGALAQPFTISGDVATHVDLGVPALPASLGGALGPVSLAIGDQRLKVWHSPDGVRVAHLLDLGEQDLVANAHDAWFWDSSSMSAVHAAVPPAATQPPSVPAAPDLLSIAQQGLAALAPYADVTVEGTAVVAGRPCYELVLTPTSTLTLIGRVAVAVDAGTRLPLRLQVFPRGSGTAAIDGGFTSVSFDPIDPSMFTFAPPPGTTVRQAADVLRSAWTAGSGTAPPAEPAGPADHRVFGSGFDTRVAVRLHTAPPKELSALLPYAGPLLSAVTVERDGATWLLVGPVSVATLEGDAASLP